MDVPRSPILDAAFRDDVLAGLGAPIRAIPARWFYDRRGSELFEAITRLPEYYLTRTETALLERRCPDVARIAGPGQAVVEFGSGASVKTRILLAAAAPSAYVPIDISGDFLRDAAASLADDFPGLPVHPIEADFTRPIRLPGRARRLAEARLLPGLDHRQHDPGDRSRPAPGDAPDARHRRLAVHRLRPGQGPGRAAPRL